MSLLKKLFGRSPKINAATVKIGEQIYLMNYRDHYAELLGEPITPHRLAELFLFRAWTAQFGYRVFSSNQQASERLIGEVVNASRYLGLGMFQQVHGFSVESELGSDFMTLIEDRWQEYDLVVSSMPKTRMPTMEVVCALAKRLVISDPTVTHSLSMEFLRQLDLIKRTAMEIGVLRSV